MEDMDSLDCKRKKKDIAYVTGHYNDQAKGLKVKVVKLPLNIDQDLQG